MESYSRIHKQRLDLSDVLTIVCINRLHQRRWESQRKGVPDQWTEAIILPIAENNKIDCCRCGKRVLQLDINYSEQKD